MQFHAFRLLPHQDLKAELDEWARAGAVEAACVMTCVGSLRRAVLRFADRSEGTVLEGKFEIVSLTGVLSRHGSHYHITISDGEGRCFGGHLLEGCHIYTTAEIALGLVPDVRFLREPCSQSGYDELVVEAW